MTQPTLYVFADFQADAEADLKSLKHKAGVIHDEEAEQSSEGDAGTLSIESVAGGLLENLRNDISELTEASSNRSVSAVHQAVEAARLKVSSFGCMY